MTVFYSMPKLQLLSNNNVDKIINLLRDNNRSIKGESFLLNPIKLINSINSNLHKAEYVYLASFRNYADYALLGIDYLDMSYIPDIDIVMASRNPLISIENKIIKFKKEK